MAHHASSYTPGSSETEKINQYEYLQLNIQYHSSDGARHVYHHTQDHNKSNQIKSILIYCTAHIHTEIHKIIQAYHYGCTMESGEARP